VAATEADSCAASAERAVASPEEKSDLSSGIGAPRSLRNEEPDELSEEA